MPVYDYQCAACGTEFEVQRPLGATGSVKCAKCGSTKTTKVFSATGIVFKGSGFYSTDSKSPPGESRPSGKPLKDAEGADKPAASDAGEKPATTEAAAKSEKPKQAADKDAK